MPFEVITPKDLQEALTPLMQKIETLEKKLARYENTDGTDWIKTEEAARLLSCSEASIRNYVAWGIIKKYKMIDHGALGKRIFDRSEINFLKQNPQLRKRPAI